MMRYTRQFLECTIEGFESRCVPRKFFQSQWDTFDGSICDMVRHVLEGHQLNPWLNKTLLVLLPKM